MNKSEIIEILFERVQLKNTIDLLTKKIPTTKLNNYSTLTASQDINIQSNESLFNSINESSNGAFYFNFSNFPINNISFLKLGFYIDKYDKTYDLILFIEENELKEKLSILELKKFAEKMATELRAKDYFCGYEPAKDKETRFFSTDSLGPIFEWGKLDK